uniref:Uncharacterized protein n=1 Tax=Physcomitrium patens TaxID=3218 RepID=A0A2K1L8P9_PHYPA|nr:hypothetical protein PHYPA_000795 [Physcomitrium patens]
MRGLLGGLYESYFLKPNKTSINSPYFPFFSLIVFEAHILLRVTGTSHEFFVWMDMGAISLFVGEPDAICFTFHSGCFPSNEGNSNSRTEYQGFGRFTDSPHPGMGNPIQNSI